MSAESQAALRQQAQQAARAGDAATLSECFSRGLVLEASTDVNPRVILAAMDGGSVACMRELVAHGWDVNHVLEMDGSALTSACLHRNLPLVRYLLAQGADPNCEYGNGDRVALYWAAANPWDRDAWEPDILDAMLDTGKVRTEEKAAVLFAVEEGTLEAVRLLVEKGDGGINSSHRWGIGSRRKGPATPLYAAALRGRTDVVRYLLNKGAEESKSFQDKDGKTAKDVAEEKGFNEIVSLL